MHQNYYEVLGIARDASPAQIKLAYRKLARCYHPDVSQQRDAEEKMQTLNVAYHTLSHPEKKQRYNQIMSHFDSTSHYPPATANAEQNHADAKFTKRFSHFERAAYHGGFDHYRYRMPIRGEDQYARLDAPLEVAFNGLTQTIFLQNASCHAQAHTQYKTVHVRIPPGVQQGQLIRLIGLGQAGTDGGAAGDLYLEMNYQRTPDLYIDGADIYYHIHVSPWEAALGQDIEILTPSSRLRVHIPKNTVYGQQIHIQDKGIPANVPGQLYLVLNIVYPRAESEQQQWTYAHDAQAFSHFNPRAKGEHL